MSRPDLERRRRQEALTAALREIRRLKGLSPAALADAMRLSLRAYQRFESGETPADIERILSFAAVTDCDPAALLCLPLFDHPEVALRSADNKLLLIMVHAFERLGRTMGEDLRKIEALSAITEVESALDRLAKDQSERDAAARRWLARGSPQDPGPQD